MKFGNSVLTLSFCPVTPFAEMTYIKPVARAASRLIRSSLVAGVTSGTNLVMIVCQRKIKITTGQCIVLKMAYICVYDEDKETTHIEKTR